MKKTLLLLTMLLCVTPLRAADNSETYYVPAPQLNAALQIMDMGFSHIFALFRNATGSFSFDDTNKSISNLRIALDMTSLIANSNENQRDLATMFGVFQFPELRISAPDSVTFTNNKAQIKATLSLHGVSKPITFDAVLNKAGKTARAGGLWSSEGEAVGISLRGVIKRSDFGLAENAEAQPRFGDNLNLSLELLAIKQ
ncbi:MAG: YceI family protein [Alphaproteobacteria bacterium]